MRCLTSNSTNERALSGASMLALLALIAPVAPSSAADSSHTGRNAAWTLPRTQEGRPDFQGVWANDSITPFERPAVFAGKAQLSPEELEDLKRRVAMVLESNTDAVFADGAVAAAYAKDYRVSSSTTGGYGNEWMGDLVIENRTSLIIDPPDGKLPPRTPQAIAKEQERQRYLAQHPADSWEDRMLSERCMTFGAPFLAPGYNSYYQIFQTPDVVAIHQEMIHAARLVRMDGSAHIADDIRLWHGDSRGRWDGDTLVIETRNYSEKTNLRGAGSGRRVTERITRTAADVLQWDITVEDPATFVRPWTARINFRRSDHALIEYACHEGNYALPGILAGARAAERAASQKTIPASGAKQEQ